MSLRDFDLCWLWARLGGRSFLLIVFFAVTGFILALRGLLTAHYVELITALSGFHVARTVASDHFESREPRPKE